MDAGFVLLALLVMGEGYFTTDAKDCSDPIDIIFVLDGSQSLGSFNWEKMKSAVIVFIQSSITIGVNARFGVVVYSTDVNPEGILELMSPWNIINRISNLDYPARGRDTRLGIIEASNMFFRIKIAGFTQTMIVITDGFSRDGRETENAANQARAKGINIFSVGIFTLFSSSGRRRFQAELLAIASAPQQSMLMQDFRPLKPVLLGFLTDITKVCYSTKACTVPAGMVFVLDGSKGIKSSNFEKMKNAVLEFIKSSSVTMPNSRFGVVVYSTGVRQDGIIELNSGTNIEKRVRNLAYPERGTDLHLGINEATEMFLRSGEGDLVRFMILITGTVSRLTTQIEDATNNAQSNGIFMLAVGVVQQMSTDERGDFSEEREYFTDELAAITPIQNLYIMVNRFNMVPDTLLALLKIQVGACINRVAADCSHPMNIIFVLDGSQSMGSFNWEKIKDAVNEFIKSAMGTSPRVSFGVVVYSTGVKPEGILELMSPWNIVNRVSNLDYPARGTDTHLGIIEASNMFFRNKMAGVTQTMIVITDGLSRIPTETENAAIQARAKGINIFSAGIFTQFSSSARRKFTAELSAIASTLQQSILLDDVKALTSTLLSFLNEITEHCDSTGAKLIN